MKFIGKPLLRFIKDFTVIDLETTGRSNKHFDITEISAIKYREGKVVDYRSSLIKADNSIIPFVVNLTGITNEMISEAPKINDVIESFVEFIGSDVILGHNVEFDYGLVFDAYHAKTGKIMFNNYIDTLRISRLLIKEIPNHKLETLCNYYGVERKIAHRGLEDSKQTAEVYLQMFRTYQELIDKKTERERFYERI